MQGTKAQYFEEQCATRGQAYLRFDYSGHGQSEGIFENCTIGDWLEDALAILDHGLKQHSGKVLVIGSSMGGWIALLLAEYRPEALCGLIGIAAAPDFTEDMFAQRLTPEQQKTLMETGIVAVENDYSDEPYHFSKSFYQEAKNHLLLDKPQNPPCPIHLFQGKQDADVPWQTAVKIQKCYGEKNVEITFIEDGDHRLSRPQDLAQIDSAIRKASGV